MAIAYSERPYVSVNFALTWDARISTRNHTPSDFSSPRDKHRLLEIRAQADAVLASAKTVAADRMTMGLPDENLRRERLTRGQKEYPTRVLLTNSGRIDPDVPVFSKTFSPVLVFSTEQMPREVRKALDGRATLILDQAERVNLISMMSRLRKVYGIERLVCEGGGEVFRSLLAASLVDEIFVTLCPRVFGGVDAPTLTGRVGEFLPGSTKCELREMTVNGVEAFLRYTVLHPEE